jgi:hypothetical protein
MSAPDVCVAMASDWKIRWHKHVPIHTITTAEFALPRPLAAPREEGSTCSVRVPCWKPSVGSREGTVQRNRRGWRLDKPRRQGLLVRSWFCYKRGRRGPARHSPCWPSSPSRSPPNPAKDLVNHVATMDWVPVIEPFIEDLHLQDFRYSIPRKDKNNPPTVVRCQVRVTFQPQIRCAPANGEGRRRMAFLKLLPLKATRTGIGGSRYLETQEHLPQRRFRFNQGFRARSLRMDTSTPPPRGGTCQVSIFCTFFGFLLFSLTGRLLSYSCHVLTWICLIDCHPVSNAPLSRKHPWFDDTTTSPSP